MTPDMTTVGKAMANGYAIAAVVGKREIMSVYVKDVFLSSTYFPNSLEMVAAMTCLEILEREKVQDVIWERGTRFLDRLGAIVDASGVPVTKSGIPPMPFLTFDHVDDHYKERRTEFYTQCIRRGLFVQPYHHWYICYRHTEADLDARARRRRRGARLRGRVASLAEVARRERADVRRFTRPGDGGRDRDRPHGRHPLRRRRRARARLRRRR